MTLPENECPGYYNMYLKLVSENILEQLEEQLESYPKFVLNEIPAEKELYRYKENKWTVRESIGHITDTERIMSFRAFCIGRGDKSPLPGFDPDGYVANTDFNSRTLADMIEEFKATRRETIAMFKTMRDEDLKKIGTASEKSASSRALFYFVLGHLQHHVNILKDRYLK